MIYGIGIDTVTVARVAKAAVRARFITRCYGAREQKLYYDRGANVLTLAGGFAAKEALVKALGVGLFKYELTSIEVLREESGKPYFALSGEIAHFIEDKHLKIHLSITHEGEIASAFVIIEDVSNKQAFAF